ncbi:cache domain-containing protein [bacterium]|nr:cache domain-containing protein [bacterium]
MRISLKMKIVGIAIIPLVLVMIIFTTVSTSSIISEGETRIVDYRIKLIDDVKERLKTRTEIAVNSIRKFQTDENSEESKQKAMEMVKNLKYGDSGYFWINDFYPKMVMHPNSPELDGTSLRENKDPNGVYLFNEMVKVAKANGEGYVPYMWPKPGFDKPQPKMSYVMAFTQWDWIIGTGVYIDDIDRLIAIEEVKVKNGVQSMVIQNIVIGLILIIIISLGAYFFVNSTVTKRIFDLVNSLKNIENKADFSIRASVEGSDEIAESKQAFNDLITSIQFSIQDLNTVLTAMSNGDLTQKITTDAKGDLDDLKISANKSIDMLKQIIIDVMEASAQVNSGSEELSRSSQSLAAGTTQQAASVEEISSSMSEVGSQTKINSENATSAKQLSQKMMEIVENGNRQMDLLLVSMNEINETSTNVNKIIKVIDEIAFQTNLLALNAAVEAARAGKYGKGFAVVAEEVRNLASRSAEAARSTTQLIETSVGRVEEGVKNSENTAQILQEISTNATKVNDLVSEIAASSIEQTKGIEEVNSGLNQINSVIQQNASISEEAASSSEQLSALAQQLQYMMKQFEVGEREDQGGFRKTVEFEQDYHESEMTRRTIPKPQLTI